MMWRGKKKKKRVQVDSTSVRKISEDKYSFRAGVWIQRTAEHVSLP